MMVFEIIFFNQAGEKLLFRSWKDWLCNDYIQICEIRLLENVFRLIFAKRAGFIIRGKVRSCIVWHQ
jgi:hypothetical protein